jgi:hypothetical protein
LIALKLHAQQHDELQASQSASGQTKSFGDLAYAHVRFNFSTPIPWHEVVAMQMQPFTLR